MFNIFKQSPAAKQPQDAEDVVDLADIDLDFAVEDAFRQQAPKVVRSNMSVPATADELAGVELFRGLEPSLIAEFAPKCLSLRVVPGYVLYPVGRFNTRLYCVLEGQLRIYTGQGDKRPRGIVDVGQTCGLTLAINMQPADHALVATEETHLLAIETPALNRFVARSPEFAKNYAELVASHTRGDNCLMLGVPGAPPARQNGYIDPDTLLHNQHWLATMLPRLVERCRKSAQPLSLIAIRIDRLFEIERDAGAALGLTLLDTVGRMLVEQSRPTDLHVIDQSRRLLVTMPNTNLDAARVVAGRLRDQAKNLTLGDIPLPPITLSIGILSLAAEETVEQLLVRAESLIQKSIDIGGNWLSEP